MSIYESSNKSNHNIKTRILIINDNEDINNLFIICLEKDYLKPHKLNARLSFFLLHYLRLKLV